MANFISGMIKGGVLSAVALVTASVLLPARPKVPAIDAAQSVPLDPSPSILDANQTDEVAAPKVAPSAATPETPKPAAVETEAVAPTDQAKAEIASAEPSPAVAKEALLDPSPTVLEPAISESAASGAKMVPAPTAIDTPKVGTASLSQTAQSISETAAPVVAQVATPAADNAPPLEKYAAKFDIPDSKPLFAVILRDTGAKDLDRAALAALPFPVTFAIDPEAENAADAMAIYRAAGKEVVMLTAGLPNGATAQDLEQAFQAYETILPEAVAVMGPATGGFQDNAVLSKLIVPVIAAQGRGMITFDRGLNSAAQNAVRDGLANGTVFRQVDGGGESVSVIRRYLDRAVFKAAQDRTAIVMGQTLPDTITALMEWSMEGRAAEVTLAPVSAILR